MPGTVYDLNDTTIQIVGHHRGAHRDTRISRGCHRSREKNIYAAHAHGLGHKAADVIRPALQVSIIVAIEHKHVLQAVRTVQMGAFRKSCIGAYALDGLGNNAV